jgi:hypothetical protein
MCDLSFCIIRLGVFAIASAFPSLSTAAQITVAEYYVGTDPGVGNGTPLTLQDTGSLGSGIQQASLALVGKPPGTYTIGIRVRDDQDRWSNPALRRFTIQAGDYELAGGVSRNGSADQGMSDPSNSGIGNFEAAVAEYFIGSDPGAGSGIFLPLHETLSLATSFQQVSLSLAGKEPGTYTVGIRIRDSQDRWSNPALRRFTVQSAGLVTETTLAAEVYASGDLDPPVAARWSLALDSFSGNTVTLQAGGFPIVFNRVNDETTTDFLSRIRMGLATDLYISSRFTLGAISAGAFTLTAKAPGPASDFLFASEELQITSQVQGSLGAAGRKIVAAEYFWDLDPGKGSGQGVPVASNGNEALVSSQTLSLADLAGGNHRVGVRFKNAAGRWGNPVYRGLTSFVLFGVQDFAAPVLSLVGENRMTIKQGSQFLDPGVTALDTNDGDVSPKVVVTLTVDPTRVGVQTVEYAVVDRAGNISRLQREVEVLASDPDGDTNGSGLPDAWIDEHFPGQNVDPDADADGDGATNRMEYLTGTNPNDPSSVFRPVGSFVGTVYTLPVPTVVGRSYKVWATRDLSSWHLEQTFVGNGSVQNFIFDESSIHTGPLHTPDQPVRCFFRVEVSMP